METWSYFFRYARKTRGIMKVKLFSIRRIKMKNFVVFVGKSIVVAVLTIIVMAVGTEMAGIQYRNMFKSMFAEK